MKRVLEDVFRFGKVAFGTVALFVLLTLPGLCLAQQKGMSGMKGAEGMCPMCGGATVVVLGGLFLLAATAALIALAVFLVRRSRAPR